MPKSAVPVSAYIHAGNASSAAGAGLRAFIVDKKRFFA